MKQNEKKGKQLFKIHLRIKMLCFSFSEPEKTNTFASHQRNQAQLIGWVAQQNKQALGETERFKYDLYYFIALRTQVNLLNSIVCSISPKWALIIPTFPSCCKEFITMHKQSIYHSACKLAVCIQEMIAVVTDNKVIWFSQ